MSIASGRERVSSRLGAWSAGALLWGLAEATLFFIVPDVLLSYVTLRKGVRIALLAAAAAVVGALMGGAAMYLWARSSPAEAQATLDLVPAIGPAMIAGVEADIAGQWRTALFAGAFSGVPYKIFAVEAGRAGLDLGAFLAASAPARYARFAVTVLVTALARQALAGVGKARWSAPLLTGFWICFYAAYFAMMPA